VISVLGLGVVVVGLAAGLIAVMVVVLARSREPDADRAPSRPVEGRCPLCAEAVEATAARCPHCGERFA